MKTATAFLFTLFMAFSASATEHTVMQASVSLEDCQKLLAAQAKNDPAYKPGVDVYGNPVAPADVEPTLGQIQLPDEIVIDFGLDLAGRYNINGSGLYTATAGILTIHYDIAAGGLTVNGRPLHQDDTRAVLSACRMMVEEGADASKETQ